MIKAVIFDLDGTLLNRDASVHKFIASQYDRLNEWIGNIPKEKYIWRFIELDCRGYVWKDKVYQQMVEEFKITEISWERLLEDYQSEFYQSCVPFTNVLSTLECLRSHSIKLGMITNGKGRFQMDNIKALGIENYFDAILISEWEGVKKPNPDIFLKALDRMNVSPLESMYVGDHPENDVIAAKNVGMAGVWKKDFQWKNVEADYIVEDLKEVLLIIQELNGTKSLGEIKWQ